MSLSSPTEHIAEGTAHPPASKIDLSGDLIHPVGPELACVLAPATHVVHEWRDYRVTCEGAAWLEVGSQSIEAVAEGVFLIRFENQLGVSRLRALDSGGRVLASSHVEVVSPKLGGVNQSLTFFRAMLADLVSERGALAFLPRAQTARTVRAVQRPPSLLMQYFFLLRNADSINEATHLIERSPHRVLDDESQHVSLFDLAEIDADVVLQLVQGDAGWDRSTSPARLTAAPAGVWFRAARESFDSAENRFVKAVATSMADACAKVLRAPWLGAVDDPGVARRRDTLSRLQARLSQFSRAPMFDDVGPMHRVPSASRVLQRRAGYRDLNMHWQAFLTSREPVWQRLQEAIDLRDVATLYEYWVWFALCREIEEATGERPVIDTLPAAEAGLPHGLRATFRDCGRLTYNASCKAYSGVWLRPDYLWEPSSGGKVAFDAKFRLAWDATPLDADREELATREAKAKADDLVKMHAYRDAIPGLRAAVVIYPGTVAEFRPVAGLPMPGLTVADVLSGEIEGVGAIPMRPEGIRE